jgi:hypothetical protein
MKRLTSAARAAIEGIAFAGGLGSGLIVPTLTPSGRGRGDGPKVLRKHEPSGRPSSPSPTKSRTYRFYI